jgi:hypothetical protein
LTGKKNPDKGDWRALRKSTETLRYSLDIWQKCYRRVESVHETGNQLGKISRSLGGWYDCLITYDSVDNFLSGAAPDGIADSSAFMKFQKLILKQAADHLAAYMRGRKPLRRSLKRLLDGFD